MAGLVPLAVLLIAGCPAGALGEDTVLPLRCGTRLEGSGAGAPLDLEGLAARLGKRAQLLHDNRVLARVNGCGAHGRVRERVHCNRLARMLLAHVLQNLHEPKEFNNLTGSFQGPGCLPAQQRMLLNSQRFAAPEHKV